jgi:hypothetical protein
MDQAEIGAVEAATAFSAMASYNKDAIFIGAAVENLAKGFAPIYDTMGDLTGYGECQMGMRVAGKYTADKFAVSAIFQSLSDMGGVAGLSATTMGAEVMMKMNEKYAFKGGYYMADPNTDVNDNEYNLLALGVDHTYTKAVMFYLQYAMMMNGNNSMMGIGGNGWGTSIHASAAGESPYGLSVGSVVKF